jgi:hypothetical protein
VSISGPAFADLNAHLFQFPDEFSPGSVEKMKMILQYNWAAWSEVPGAIAFLIAKVKGGV